MKKNMKKILKNASFLSLACILCAFLFTACANPSGLHNQCAAKVTFVFTNFGDELSGDFTIPGNFNDWDNTQSLITMTNGEGTSTPITISQTYIEFTLVKTNDGWNRAWYPDVKGNDADKNTAGNPYQNFYIKNLDLNAGEITLVMDGTSGTAIPTVQ